MSVLSQASCIEREECKLTGNLAAVDSRRIRVEGAAGNRASPEAWRS